MVLNGTQISLSGTGTGSDVLDQLENIITGSGSDSFNANQLTTQTMNAGGGTDTLLLNAIGAWIVNLAANSATSGTATGPNSSILTLINFENVTGGSDTDIITGNGLANVLSGGGGGDTLNGGLGGDTLIGGAGTNTLNGGGGTDRASYSFASSAATITKNANGSWHIVSAANSVDDTLTGVERATFSGGTTVALREDTRSEVNGDGTSDIIWVNAANGPANYFQMSNSANAAWSLAGSIGTTWTAVKSGDFTGDGSADIFYRRASDGAIGFLDQDSNGAWGWNGSGLVGSAWAVRATGDLNGDGTSDVLYQNDALGGALGVLSMTNGVGSWAGMGAVNPAWTAVGAGNINGDGTSDIVFYNQSNGALNALTVANGVGSWIGIAGVANTWSVGGIGDLNGDGTSDILMYNASLGGALGYFQMDNGVGTWTAIGGVGAVGAAWTVKAMGDYNNDGYSDILFYNSAIGAAGLLTESASGVVTWSGLGAINSAWQVL